MKSRSYGSWTRQNHERTPRPGGRASGRASGRATPRTRERARGRNRARGTSRGVRRGLRYDRLLLVAAGVVLILFSVGMVFSDVQEAGKAAPAIAPKDRDMTLTVPSMKRVKDVPVYSNVDDEAVHHPGGRAGRQADVVGQHAG